MEVTQEMIEAVHAHETAEKKAAEKARREESARRYRECALM